MLNAGRVYQIISICACGCHVLKRGPLDCSINEIRRSTKRVARRVHIVHRWCLEALDTPDVSTRRELVSGARQQARSSSGVKIIRTAGSLCVAQCRTECHCIPVVPCVLPSRSPFWKASGSSGCGPVKPSPTYIMYRGAMTVRARWRRRGRGRATRRDTG